MMTDDKSFINEIFFYTRKCTATLGSNNTIVKVSLSIFGSCSIQTSDDRIEVKRENTMPVYLVFST